MTDGEVVVSRGSQQTAVATPDLEGSIEVVIDEGADEPVIYAPPGARMVTDDDRPVPDGGVAEQTRVDLRGKPVTQEMAHFGLGLGFLGLIAAGWMTSQPDPMGAVAILTGAGSVLLTAIAGRAHWGVLS